MREYRNKDLPIKERLADVKTIGELTCVWRDMTEAEKDEYLKALSGHPSKSDAEYEQYCRDRDLKFTERTRERHNLQMKKKLKEILEGQRPPEERYIMVIDNGEFKVYTAPIKAKKMTVKLAQTVLKTSKTPQVSFGKLYEHWEVEGRFAIVKLVEGFLTADDVRKLYYGVKE